MSAKLRVKLATSLNNIEKPEDWSWNRWLKQPTNKSFTFSLPKIQVINKKYFNRVSIEIPGNDGFLFDDLYTILYDGDSFFKLLKIQSSKAYKISLPLQKTVRLFINVMPAKASKNIFKNKLEPGKSITTLIERNISVPFIKNIKGIESETIIKDILSSKRKIFTWTETFSESYFLENHFLKGNPDNIIFSNIPFIEPAVVSECLVVNENNIVVREIEFVYNVYHSRYSFEFANTSESINMLPADADTPFIDENILAKYYFKENNTGKVTCNLLSSEYLTKFIEPQYLQRYFFENIHTTLNLLPDSQSINIIDNEILQKYYRIHSEVSDELLSVIPDSYNLSLLNTDNFEIEVINIENTGGENFPVNTSVYRKFHAKEDQLNKASVANIAVNKFPVNKKHIRTLQIPNFQNPEITKNICTKKLIQKAPSIKSLDSETVIYTEDYTINESALLHSSATPIIQYETTEFTSLLPLPEIEIDKQIESFLALYDYQRKGVDFLINNSFAILVDDPGLGKTIQSIIALRLLFKVGLLKSVLILCPESEFGSIDLSILSGKSEGWEGHFYNWAPELTIKVIYGDEGQRRIDWNDSAQVFITSFTTLSSDIRKKLIDFDYLKKFNNLIIDDIRCVQIEFIENKKIFEKLKLNYLWILNDFPFDYHLNEMICTIKPSTEDNSKIDLSVYYSNKPEVPDTYLRRQKSDINNYFPPKSYIDKWIELQPEQYAEYDFTLSAGIQKISDSLQTGNILIIQPQIYNILHQLMQICNYPSNATKSSKEELLLTQLDTFIQNREKVVILSQYEKQGIKKLEEIFNKEKIGFVAYHSGMSENVLIKNIKDFNSKDNISVFLADSKALKGVLNLGAVTNIIHFDHWWNPITTWQIEDKIVTGNNKKNVNIYTYWTNNTIEEKIYRILSQKGLFIKGIVESLSSIMISEMINTDEWLGILGIPSNEETSYQDMIESVFEKLKNISTEAFKEMGKTFLSKLGFSSNRYMTYVDGSGNDINLTSKIVNGKEETIIVKFVHSDIIEAVEVSEFVRTIMNYKNISRSYFITSGIFSREAQQFTTYKQDKLNLIDGKTYSNYLLRFNLI